MKPKLGSGERFKRLSKELKKKGARDPDALAAWIGRKTLGKKRFQKLAAKGRTEGLYTETIHPLAEKLGEGLDTSYDPHLDQLIFYFESGVVTFDAVEEALIGEEPQDWAIDLEDGRTFSGVYDSELGIKKVLNKALKAC